MAIGSCDNRFDYCNELLEVKANYSYDECCNIVKNSLKTFKGADAGFLKDVCARPNSSFSIKQLYFPVYNTNFTVTYDWDEENVQDKGDYTVTTTTHHTNTNTNTKNFYRNIYSACCPDTFVGRNDQRFYVLSHVNDLKGSIYNNACVYSQSDLSNAIETYAGNGRPTSKATYLVNRWSVTVLFVPVVVVSYVYNGVTYSSTVNSHNGKGYFEYCVSKESLENAEKAHKIAKTLQTISFSVAGISLIVSLFSGFWTSLLSIILLVVLIVVSVKMKHDKQYFLNYFGANGGSVTAGSLSGDITHLCCSAIISLLIIVLCVI